MEKILSELDSIAQKVEDLEKKREKLGKFLNRVKDVEISDNDILENRLSIPVDEGDLGGKKIAGIDGGLVKRAYHAVDLVLTKAVAAIFEYGEGLENVSYVPGALPTPKLSVLTEPYSREDFSQAANLERMEVELSLVLEMIRNKDTDMILMDGSIVPHPSSVPGKDSELREKFEEVLKKYENIFEECGCILAGVSEDSRARRLSNIVSNKVLDKVDSKRKEELRDILKGTRDSNLLFHTLNQGERSFCFPYFSGSNSPFPKEISNKIYSFYLKTTKYDRPIRVDYLAPEDPVERADKVASCLLPVSSQNEEYGIPSMIVEADKRASLKEEELDFIYSSLQDKVGDVPALYKLRRNNRPF